MADQVRDPGTDAGATVAGTWPPHVADDGATVVGTPAVAAGDTGATRAFDAPEASGRPVAAVAPAPPVAPRPLPDALAPTLPAPAPGAVAPVAAGTHEPSVPTWPAEARRRRTRRIALALVAMVAVIAAATAVVLRSRSGATTAAAGVVGVTATAPPTAGCDQTVTVAGVITTDGAAGRVAYHWARNDGQSTATQEIATAANQTTYAVILNWALHGRGRFAAAATLAVTTPAGVAPATAHFVYSC